jgi:transcriptional regulator with XRE-family HTH domain
MIDKKDFSDWLMDELKVRGWDQAELARRSTVTAAQISRIVSGTRNAGPEACKAIAQALGIPPYEVFRRVGLLPSRREDPLADELAHLLPLLPEEDVAILVRIARGMVAERASQGGNGKVV